VIFAAVQQTPDSCWLLLLLLLSLLLQAGVLGALGLAAGLLLETTLLIIRTNMPVPLDQKYAHLMDKRWDGQQQQQGKLADRKSSSMVTLAGGSKAHRKLREGGGSSGIHHAKKE
jgi:hypothetical protein